MFRAGGGGCGSAGTGLRARGRGAFGVRGSGGLAERRRSREGSPRLEETGDSACRVSGSVFPDWRLHSEQSGRCSFRGGEAGEALRGAAAASGNPTGSPT